MATRRGSLLGFFGKKEDDVDSRLSRVSGASEVQGELSKLQLFPAVDEEADETRAERISTNPPLATGSVVESVSRPSVHSSVSAAMKSVQPPQQPQPQPQSKSQSSSRRDSGPSLAQPSAATDHKAIISAVTRGLPSASLEDRETAVKVLKDIDLCRVLHTEDRLFEGAQLLKKIEAFVSGLSEDLRQFLEQQVYDVNDKSLPYLRAVESRLSHLLFELENSTNWNEWNSSIGPHQDVTVSTHKHHDNGSTESKHGHNVDENDYSLKIEGNVYMPMKAVAAAMIETQLYPFWVPMCSGFKVIKSLSSSRKIVKIDLDFVMLKKTAVMEIKSDRLADGRLLVSFTSLPIEENLSLYPKDSQKHMLLSGGLLFRQQTVEIEQAPGGDPTMFIAKSQLRAEDILLRSATKSPLGTMASCIDLADVYHVPSTSAKDNEPAIRFAENPLRSKSVRGLQTPTKLSLPTFDVSQSRTQAVHVTGIFEANLLMEFLPDWIFNLAVRSAISMFIPMLEHHSSLFLDGEYHHPLITANAQYYEKLEKLF